jgi:hypothetical protein
MAVRVDRAGKGAGDVAGTLPLFVYRDKPYVGSEVPVVGKIDVGS